jgi:CDP-diacylglycerol--glycerol-3-phosphate 3-phosphatidyltransferase
LDLYRSKPAILRRLDRAVRGLANAGVSADALTLAAIPLGLLGGIALLVSPTIPATLLLVPLVVGVRLVLNLLDGALARLTDRVHPRGELYNEVGDRIADICLIAPVAFLPGAQREIVLLGVVGAVFASYAGLAPRAAGAERIYRGVLSKPGRMLLLSIFALAVLVLGPSAWAPFGPLLLIGTFLTAVERIAIGVRRLP